MSTATSWRNSLYIGTNSLNTFATNITIFWCDVPSFFLASAHKTLTWRSTLVSGAAQVINLCCANPRSWHVNHSRIHRRLILPSVALLFFTGLALSPTYIPSDSRAYCVLSQGNRIAAYLHYVPFHLSESTVTWYQNWDSHKHPATSSGGSKN